MYTKDFKFPSQKTQLSLKESQELNLSECLWRMWTVISLRSYIWGVNPLSECYCDFFREQGSFLPFQIKISFLWSAAEEPLYTETELRWLNKSLQTLQAHSHNLNFTIFRNRFHLPWDQPSHIIFISFTSWNNNGKCWRVWSMGVLASHWGNTKTNEKIKSLS